MDRKVIGKFRLILVIIVFLIVVSAIIVSYLSLTVPPLIKSLGTLALFALGIVIVIFSIILEFTSSDN